MEKNNYIYRYYQKIKDGSVIVGKWIELAFEYIVNGIENKDFYFDQKKANDAIRFIQSKCHHSEGALAPNCLKLELWQKAIVSTIFGCVDENGHRQFNTCLIVVGRKNGKTLLASSIIQQMIYNDGEYGAKAYCCAPKLDQADLVFDAFWQSVQLDDELKRMTKSRKSDKYVKRTNSKVQKIALNERTNDGFNAHLYVADEIHAWRGDKGLKQWEVMSSGLGAREQPLILATTTSGFENDSIYDELMKRATRLLLGDSDEKKFIPFLYMIDDVEKWDDIDEIAKANPNLSVSVSVSYLLEEIAKAKTSLSAKASFLTKHCNIKQNSSQAWLSTETVNKMICEPLNLEDFRSSYAVIGVDLSQSVDLTAATCIIEKDGILYVFAKFWIPAEKVDEASERDGVPYNIYIQRGFLETSGDHFVDYHDCYNWLTSLVEQYEILPLCVGYDRFSAQYLVKDLESYGFRCSDVYQGDNLHPVIQEMEGLAKSSRIRIGDNDLLKIHLLNSAVKYNVERGRGKLVKLKQTARIDGVAALLDGLTVRQSMYEEIGEQLKNG